MEQNKRMNDSFGTGASVFLRNKNESYTYYRFAIINLFWWLFIYDEFGESLYD
jgi:hypothetical protein